MSKETVNFSHKGLPLAGERGAAKSEDQIYCCVVSAKCTSKEIMHIKIRNKQTCFNGITASQWDGSELGWLMAFLVCLLLGESGWPSLNPL